jgi:D-arabinose 1-dehydrogenase-like Zn-dependent alcohol dehydrogenase
MLIDLGISIGIPTRGKFHMDVDPTQLLFRNQSIKGTLVSSLADITESLNFASRGKDSRCLVSVLVKLLKAV